MTDFRALCVELTDCLEKADWPHRYKVVFQQWMDIAHAALAEPDGPAVSDDREPASVAMQPTDEEIMELMPQQMRDDLAAAARALSGFDPDNIKAASVFRIILNRHCVDHALAVLARWGNHPGSPDSSLQPVPVSERLPGPGDTDPEGRCWWWYPEVPGKTYGYWAYEDDAVPERALNEQPTHWLSVHALPLPS